MAGRPRGLPKTGGGSRKGIPNKASGEVRAIAQLYGRDAINGLAILAGLAKPLKKFPGIKLASNDSTQRMALSDLLDRAYGKPSQPMEHTIDESWEAMLDRLGR